MVKLIDGMLILVN